MYIDTYIYSTSLLRKPSHTFRDISDSIKYSVSHSVSQLVCVSVCLSVSLFVCQSVCLSVCMSIYLSVCMSIYLFVCMSIYLSVCLSVYLSIFPNICLPTLYILYILNQHQQVHFVKVLLGFSGIFWIFFNLLHLSNTLFIIFYILSDEFESYTNWFWKVFNCSLVDWKYIVYIFLEIKLDKGWYK